VNSFRNIGRLYPVVAFLLAATYFCFQVEPFEDEYIEQHRLPSARSAFSAPSVTWETFDKSNAPKAFIVDPCIAIEALDPVFISDDPLDPCSPPAHPVRDKSPPSERS
jgi:hypothetical protein